MSFIEFLDFFLIFNAILLIYYGIKRFFQKDFFELFIFANEKEYLFKIPKNSSKTTYINISKIRVAREQISKTTSPKEMAFYFEILKQSILEIEKESSMDRHKILDLLNDLIAEIELKKMYSNLSQWK